MKDILVHLGDDRRSALHLQIALQLAVKHEAHLIGLYTAPLPVWPATAEGYVPTDLIDRMIEEGRKKADKQKKLFNDACRKQEVKGEWRFVEDEPLIVVPEHARYVDLAIVGQVEDEPSGEGTPSGIIGLPEDTALDSGRPVLVLPYAGPIKTLGNRILLAWDGSREASRALHDALPFLKKAKKVVVFSVNPDTDTHIPGQDISRHLARHGVKAEAKHTIAPDLDVADALLDAVADLNSDLLVMGAYGHSRIREFVLGGATRDILDQMTVPVLLSH